MTNTVETVMENQVEKDVEVMENELVLGEYDIQKLPAFFREKGLIVEETIGRSRGNITLSVEDFGVKISKDTDNNKEMKEFFENHVKAGKITFLPDAYEKQLTRIDSSVRVRKKEMALGSDRKFLPMNRYEEFLEFFAKQKEEYFMVRDTILAQWSTFVKDFSEKLTQALVEMKAENKEATYEKIMKKIPSKEAFEKSFYMDLRIKAYPVASSMDMFTPEIQEDIVSSMNDEIVDFTKSIVVDACDKALELLGAMTKNMENEKVNGKTINRIAKVSKEILEINIIEKKSLTDLAYNVAQLENFTVDTSLLLEKSEDLIFKVYKIAKDLGLENHISTNKLVYSKEQLETFSELV